MSSENPEDFEQFHFPATNCFFEQEMTPGAYNTPGTPLWDTSLEFLLNDRAVQTNCSETCYISINKKVGDFSVQKCYTCFHWNVEWKSTKEWNWYLPATNTWNKSIEIPEIWLDVTILQGIASKLFRNESYIIRKYNIVAFQNCFSYFDWNVERESRRLWTFSFSSDQLFFEHRVARALTRLGCPCATHLSSSFNNRAIQTNCSETCYISSKSWEFPLFRNVKRVFIAMSSESLQKNETDTFQRPIPEMNRLKFPKYDTILPFYSG